jgi:hypothetical protein
MIRMPNSWIIVLTSTCLSSQNYLWQPILLPLCLQLPSNDLHLLPLLLPPQNNQMLHVATGIGATVKTPAPIITSMVIAEFVGRDIKQKRTLPVSLNSKIEL